LVVEGLEVATRGGNVNGTQTGHNRWLVVEGLEGVWDLHQSRVKWLEESQLTDRMSRG
jgi:hypothetical protein